MTKLSRDDIKIRWMVRTDLREVLAIEEACEVSPWTLKQISRQLSIKNCIGIVAELDDGYTMGFAVYSLEKLRIDILRLSVVPDDRGFGVGSALVDYLERKLIPQSRTNLNACLRETNLGGQLFLRSKGFKAVAVCREYYDDTREDAFVFNYRIAGAALAQPIITGRRRDSK